jgi:hypothetical protein
MRRLLLCLLINCGTLCAQSPDNSPLNTEEQRLILQQLYELRSCRETVRSYETYAVREAEQDAREKANSDHELELEKQATALALRERDLAIDRANLFEQLSRSVTKKPGIGCRLARFLTLGIARCQ